MTRLIAALAASFAVSGCIAVSAAGNVVEGAVSVTGDIAEGAVDAVTTSDEERMKEDWENSRKD